MKFYPPIPLHLANRTHMKKLQKVQNRAIRFALGVKLEQKISSKKLHTKFKYKFRPVNQELYWRARSTWEKIELYEAGDLTMFKYLTELPIYNECKHFPSSYSAAVLMSEPAARYN